MEKLYAVHNEQNGYTAFVLAETEEQALGKAPRATTAIAVGDVRGGVVIHPTAGQIAPLAAFIK
jgi:hypothetical protein